MPRTKPATTPAPEATAPAAAPENRSEDQVTLTGRLTKDPVLRHTASGIAVTNLRIAVNHPDAEATFHSVVAWKRTAEVVCQYMKKGRLVEVTGFPRDRTWTGKDGDERTEVEINAVRIQFLSTQRTAPVPENALS
jgi:single-strand DNA-binding protein